MDRGRNLQQLTEDIQHDIVAAGKAKIDAEEVEAALGVPEDEDEEATLAVVRDWAKVHGWSATASPGVPDCFHIFRRAQGDGL
jgi:hypothetical protein